MEGLIFVSVSDGRVADFEAETLSLVHTKIAGNFQVKKKKKKIPEICRKVASMIKYRYMHMITSYYFLLTS